MPLYSHKVMQRTQIIISMYFIFLFFPTMHYSQKSPISIHLPKVVHFKNKRFIQYTGNHHTVLSENIIREPQLTILNPLDEFYKKEYNKLFKTAILKKTKIILYASQKSYITHEKVYQKNFAHYDRTLKLIYSYKQTSVGPLFHELIHHWINHNIAGKVKPWFNEGLASYYESPKKKFKKYIFTQPNWRHKKLKGKWTTLDRLMKKMYFTKSHEKAESRLIFLWLASQKTLYPYVKEFIQNYNLDPSGIETLQRVTGKTINRLNGIIKSYSDSLKK